MLQLKTIKHLYSYIVICLITIILLIPYLGQQTRRSYSSLRAFNHCTYENKSLCNDRYGPVFISIEDISAEQIFILYETELDSRKSWFRYQMLYITTPKIPQEFSEEKGKQEILEKLKNMENFVIISQIEIPELNETTTHNLYANEYYIYIPKHE